MILTECANMPWSNTPWNRVLGIYRTEYLVWHLAYLESWYGMILTVYANVPWPNIPWNRVLGMPDRVLGIYRYTLNSIPGTKYWYTTRAVLEYRPANKETPIWSRARTINSDTTLEQP